MTETRQCPACMSLEGRNAAAFAGPLRVGVEYALLREEMVPHMLDREKIVAVLKRRFPGSTPEQIATAANALVGLEDEWMEISLPVDGESCRHDCFLKQVLHGREIRAFARARPY